MSLIESALARLKADPADAEARVLWSMVENGLNMQMDSEELELLQPLLRAHQRGANVLLQEHSHLRGRLREIGTALRAGKSTAGTVRDFRDELQAHMQSELRLLEQLG
jgi:hypothetical protein